MSITSLRHDYENYTLLTGGGGGGNVMPVNNSQFNIVHRCPFSSFRDCKSDGDVLGWQRDTSPGGNHLENGISSK